MVGRPVGRRVGRCPVPDDPDGSLERREVWLLAVVDNGDQGGPPAGTLLEFVRRAIQ